MVYLNMYIPNIPFIHSLTGYLVTPDPDVLQHVRVLFFVVTVGLRLVTVGGYGLKALFHAVVTVGYGKKQSSLI